MASETVAGVFDLAQHAHDMSGEPVEVGRRDEMLDGVPHVRLVSDPVSLLLPLSAFNILAGIAAHADANVELVARAIYACELARDENANSLIIKVGGKIHPSTRLEAFEENPESWRDYARAALAALSRSEAPEGERGS